MDLRHTFKELVVQLEGMYVRLQFMNKAYILVVLNAEE